MSSSPLPTNNSSNLLGRSNCDNKMNQSGNMTNESPKTPQNNYLPRFLLGSPSSQNSSLIDDSSNNQKLKAKIDYRDNSNFTSQSSTSSDVRYITSSTENQTPLNNTIVNNAPPIESIYQMSGDYFVDSHADVNMDDGNSTSSNILKMVDYNAGYQQNNESKPTNKEEENLECWVTVFGYPSDQINRVVSQFSVYGVIIKQIISSEQSNWMHLKYQNVFQTKKALSKNGTIICGLWMIGVIPCQDYHFIKNLSSKNTSTNSNPNTLLQKPLNSFPINQSTNSTNLRTLNPLKTLDVSDFSKRDTNDSSRKSLISDVFGYFKLW